jgi:hypothetical protein
MDAPEIVSPFPAPLLRYDKGAQIFVEVFH